MRDEACFFCNINELATPVLEKPVAYILGCGIFNKYHFAIYHGGRDGHGFAEIIQVVCKKNILVAILVIIKEVRLDGKTGIIQPVFCSPVDKSEVLIVYIQHFFSQVGIFEARFVYHDIHITVVIDIHHGNAGLDSFTAIDSSSIRNIPEL